MKACHSPCDGNRMISICGDQILPETPMIELYSKSILHMLHTSRKMPSQAGDVALAVGVMVSRDDLNFSLAPINTLKEFMLTFLIRSPRLRRHVLQTRNNLSQNSQHLTYFDHLKLSAPSPTLTLRGSFATAPPQAQEVRLTTTQRSTDTVIHHVLPASSRP